MPVNASCSESKPQEFALTGFNDVTFGRVNDQLQTVLQVSTDTVKHALAGSLTFYQYRKVVSIPSELVTSFLKFLV